MKSIEDTQALWGEYMELCRKCDSLNMDDPGKCRERRALMERKIWLLRMIRGVE